MIKRALKWALPCLFLRKDRQAYIEGVYFVEFKDSFDNHLGTYEMNWDGNDEVTVFDTASTSDLADLETKIDTVDSNVDAVLVDTGTNIPSQISGVPSDVMSSAVESGFNVVNTLKILLSVLAGKIQGSSSGDDTFRTEVFRSVTDDRDVLTSKTNSDGERVEIQIHG